MANIEINGKAGMLFRICWRIVMYQVGVFRALSSVWLLSYANSNLIPSLLYSIQASSSTVTTSRRLAKYLSLPSHCNVRASDVGRALILLSLRCSLTVVTKERLYPEA